MTVVTLWRYGWSTVQQAVLTFLHQERFPDGTHFYWAAEGGGGQERALEAGERMLLQLGHSLESYKVDPVVGDTWTKHQHVASLYNTAVPRIRTPLALFVEDDEVAGVGTVAALLAFWRLLPPSTAALMAAYRSRFRPDAICARRLDGTYLPWPNDERRGLMRCLWVGGGFTLYATQAIQACLPYVPCAIHGGVHGWDMSLCASLHDRHRHLFVHQGVRVAHHCPEVLGYCGERALKLS